MTNPLSAETTALVRASVPALAQHSATITQAMYARLFQDEHIKALFNHGNQGEGGAQVHALAAAILGYAQNIENLAALAPVVERIAQKHIGYHILPEHYPYVARALLGALEDVLGDSATPPLLAAWGEAFWFLANVLKAREASIRSEIEGNDGGWTGWLWIPTKPPPRSEKIAPPYSEMMSPPRKWGLTGTDGCCFVRSRRQAAGSDFSRRMLSPSRFNRWALWTRRSRMASA